MGSKTSNTNLRHWAWRPDASERERRYHFYTMSGFVPTCISILSTWTGRAKKLDKVQFFIPPLQDENSQWYATMGHDEASKTRRGVIDHTATNYDKLGRMYQWVRWKSSAKRLLYTIHCFRATAITVWSDAGLSVTLLGYRNENSLRSSSKRSLICPESTSHTNRSEMQVFRGNQHQLQQSRSAACAMIPNQQNFTKQDERFNFSTIFSGC